MTAPGLFPSDKALQLYRDIYLIRRCEEKICEDYAGDAMKTPVHLHIGAEAICAGVLAALPAGKKIFGTYRNHGLYLPLTQDVRSFFAELYGKTTGGAGGKGGSMHLAAPEQGLCLTSAVVATTIPVAVGNAFAHAYRGENNITAVFFGDGAVEEGAFWESLNFACLKKLKIIFVCEDNDLAIHTPSIDRRGFRSIPEAVAGFNCHQASADGFDPGLVYQMTADLLKRMDQDPKPGFLHFKYFRYVEHVGTGDDFLSKYRAKPAMPEWDGMDPLKRAEQIALHLGIPASQLEQIRQKIEADISESVALAKADPFPNDQDLHKGVLSL